MKNFFRGIFDGCYLARRLRQGICAVFVSSIGAEFSSYASVLIGSACLGSDVLSAYGQVLTVKLTLAATLRLFIDAMLIVVPRAYGTGDRERADRLFGTAIAASVFMLVLSGVLTYLCRGFFLSHCTGSERLLAAAAVYYDWVFVAVATGSIRLGLERLALVEGRSAVVGTAAIVFVVSEVAALVLLTKPFGLTGLCASEAVAAAVPAGYIAYTLIRTKTSFHPRFDIRPSEVLFLAKTGLPKLSGRIGDSVILLVLNGCIISRFGIATLASVHFVKATRKFLTAIPDALDNSSTPLICAQLGERNWRGLRRTLRTVFLSSLGIGAIIAVVVFFAADFIAVHSGFPEGPQREQTVFGLRCCTLFIGLFFRKDLVASYHNCLGRIWLSSAVRFLSRGYVIMIFGIVADDFFGGGWEMFCYGVIVSDLVITAIAALVPAFLHKRGESLFFNLPMGEMARQYLFDFTYAADSIVGFASRVGAWVTQMGGKGDLAVRARLLAEESQTRLLPRSGQHREMGECLVTVAEDRASATMLFRNTLPLADERTVKAPPRPGMPVDLSLLLLNAVSSSCDYNPVIGSNRTIYTVKAAT